MAKKQKMKLSKNRKRTPLKNVKKDRQYFLGGIAKSLLGGGSSGGGGGSSTSYAYGLLPANIKKMVDDYASRASTISNTPYQAYTGERIAPLSPLEQQAADYAQANFGQTLPAIQGANALNQQLTQRALAGPTLENLQPFMSPYQQAVIDQTKRETIRDFEGTLQDIGRGAATSGAFGGSRQALMESEAYRDLNRNLTDIQERGLQSSFTNAQDQYFKSLQTSGDLAKSTAQTALYGQNAVGNDVNLLTALGAQERGLTQAGIDVDYSDFMNQLNYPVQQLNILGGALGNINPYFAPYQTAGGGSGSKGSDTLGNIANIAGTAMSLFSMFSDKRMKENTEKVGELDNGLPVYKYNYKGDPRTQIGVMAQDVEKSNPKAVSKGPGGMKMVNYEKATKPKQKFSFGGSVGGTPPFIPEQSGSWMDSLFKLLGGGSSEEGEGSEGISTGMLSKALGTAAEDTLALEKENRDIVNSVGARIANAKLSPLIAPYLTEATLANDLVRTSHQNLFKCGGMVKKYQEGGRIDMGTPGQDLLKAVQWFRDSRAPTDTTGMGVFGKAEAQLGDLMRGLTRGKNPYYDALSPEQLETYRTLINAPVGGEGEQPPQPQIQRAVAPQTTPVASEPTRPRLGSTTQTQDKVAKILTEGLAPKSDINTKIKDTMSQFGLENVQTKGKPKSNPFMDLLMTYGAYAGTPVSPSVRRNRALAAAYGSNQGNIDDAATTDKENLERRLKAIETAGELQKLQNSQDWLDYQQKLMASSVTGKGGDGLKQTKLEMDIEKALLDIRKKRLELQQMEEFTGGGSSGQGNAITLEDLRKSLGK